MLLSDREETVVSAVVGPMKMSWGMLVVCMVTCYAGASSRD